MTLSLFDKIDKDPGILKLTMSYSLRNNNYDPTQLFYIFKQYDYPNLLQLQEKISKDIIDIDKSNNKTLSDCLILYIKCPKTNAEVSIPARGKKCTHLDCMEFNVYFQFVYNFKLEIHLNIIF
jgi:hypothetical protein